MQYVTIWDFLLYPPYFFLIYYIARRVQNRNINENPVYEYYVKGMLASIFGGFMFCSIYCFYYGGGDTVAYWFNAGILNRLATVNFDAYLDILKGNLTMSNYYHLNSKTGYLEYYRDAKSFSAIRFTSIPYFLTVESYFTCTLLISALTYPGKWRLFLVFTREFPGLEKQFAIAILFFPSVVFWGSGILKDTFMFSAACWFTYSIYMVFIKREKVLPNIFWLFATTYVMISTKPYIFIALLPGTLVWVSFKRIQMMKSPVFRFLFAPIIISLTVVLGSFVIGSVSRELREYSNIQSILDKAVVTQQDLKQEYYHGNTFDIGEFDGTLTGALSKFPLAITAGLFRPFIFEARNPVMFISGVENTYLLLFTLYYLFTVGPIKLIRHISTEPLLIFSFTFAIIFAFAVGLSTANFGALVRYKIPCIPFYLSSLYIIRNYFVLKSNSKSAA